MRRKTLNSNQLYSALKLILHCILFVTEDLDNCSHFQFKSYTYFKTRHISTLPPTTTYCISSLGINTSLYSHMHMIILNVTMLWPLKILSISAASNYVHAVLMSKLTSSYRLYRGFHGVVANVLDSNIIVSKFKFQSCYYAPFGLISWGKVWNPLFPPTPTNYRLYSITTVFLQDDFDML